MAFPKDGHTRLKAICLALSSLYNKLQEGIDELTTFNELFLSVYFKAINIVAALTEDNCSTNELISQKLEHWVAGC